MSENTSYISDKYKEAISILNVSIAIQQDRQGRFVSYTKEYQDALKEEIRLQKEKLEITNKQVDALEEAIQEYKK